MTATGGTTLNNHQLPYSKHIKPKKQHEIKHLSEVNNNYHLAIYDKISVGGC